MSASPKTCLLFLWLATLSALAAVSPHSPGPPTNSVEAGARPRQIVTCREDVDVDALLKEHRVTLKHPKHHLRAFKGFIAVMEPGLIRRLRADPRVVAVEEDGPIAPAGDGPIPLPPPSSLPGLPPQFGLYRMDIPRFPIAHINGTPDPIDVDVAVADSGIDPHEDLNVVHTYSSYGGDGTDLGDHGTGVAGVLGAIDNGIGITGVAPGVRIWNVQSFGLGEDNSWSNFILGLAYVRDHADEISVVNISYVNEGTVAPRSAIKASIRNLVRRGVVVVAAAGNSGWDLAGPDGIYDTGDDAYPAALAYSMAVSGMDSTVQPGGTQYTDVIWPSSNFSQVPRPVTLPDTLPYPVSPGGAIDVAAPAVNIVTTRRGVGLDGISHNYGFGSGTSFAAPHVAGLVALYIAANGRATNEAGVYRIRQAIVDASLPQSQWRTNNTHDPDSNPEPLAMASESWIPRPVLTIHTAGTPGHFQLKFATIPGYDFTLQSATNLTPPILWTRVATVSGSSNVTLASVTDTNTASQRFYRIDRQASGPSGGPPFILVQPISWAKLPGATVTLNVSVGPIAPFFGYQWQKDGSPLADGGNVSGTATSSLVVTNVQAADLGAYSVVVTNYAGSVTSAVANLTLLTNLSSASVTGVVATATSELAQFNRVASNAVNGGPQPWESVGVDQGFGEDRKPAITFDLGAVRPLANTVVWNGSEQPASIKRMVIEVSMDGVGFSPLGEFTLTIPSPASETLPLGGVVCRYVRFTIKENGAGQIFPPYTTLTSAFAEIDEVEFQAYPGN